MKVRIRQSYKKAKAMPAPGGGVPKLAFLLTGGGTGGHVIPAIAVARELRRRGHQPFFVGTREGMESKLVPRESFPIEYVEIGGLKRVGWRQTLRTMAQLPLAVYKAWRILKRHQPAAVFSMGGYVAGPATIAAWLRRCPIVLMEPNAMPGMANRYAGKLASRALLSFEEAKQYFPARKVAMTGLPVRSEFFEIQPKAPSGELTVLVTGGSRGSRRLNEAGRASWGLFLRDNVHVRWIHQSGPQDFEEMAEAFAASGAQGEVVAFVDNMPGAFAACDLVVCRSGAGAVAELAAAGKPSILVPFPYAADQHQLKNAEAMAKAGAARLILDRELTGEELFHTIRDIARDPGVLREMGTAARRLAAPQATRRTVEILEEEAALALGWRAS
jgi:UDP-N-acetylglucosamine--N-acetylmuramyl-(pentapeptide) pyrophosphoryl-undecaprenol N-acetylglucosamine transferase